LIIISCSFSGKAQQDSWPSYRGNPALTGTTHVAIPDNPALLWSFQTDDIIKSSPIIADGHIFIGTNGGSLYCLSPEGKEVWQFSTETSIEAPPLFLDQRVFVGSLEGIMFALDANTGKEKWRYITEGQIVVSKELHRAGIYPPIDVLPSLSRLMNEGIGEGKTREDHSGVANQLYSAYAQGRDLRDLVAVVGEEALSEVDRKYLKFADFFEKEFIKQRRQEDRTIVDSLGIGWRLLSSLPREELKKIKLDYIEKYLGKAVEVKKEEKKEVKTEKKPTKKAPAKAKKKTVKKTAKKKKK